MKVKQIFSRILLLVSANCQLEFDAAMVLDGPMWGSNPDIYGETKTLDNAASCNLISISACTLQGDLCRVTLEFSNCGPVDGMVDSCNPDHDWYEEPNIKCNTEKIDGRITKV